MPVMSTTITSMQGGQTAVTGTGEDTLVTFTGTWATGDKYLLTLIDQLSALAQPVGQGDVTGLSPSFCFTYKSKLYFIAGAKVFFSDLEAPTSFNDINGVGNGFITITNYFATAENLQALATYQGRLAIFSQTTTQIFQVDPDPDNYANLQTLQNTGTIAPFSVRSLGDMDVFFLSDTGIRSLRVRDASSNAYVADIGSPIDALVQASLSGQSASQKSAFYGVVEPSANRYWCYVNGTIYVLSYFPTSKITAWSTYLPQTLNDATGLIESFTPTKFEVHEGFVYVLDSSRYVYRYGGANGTTYDASVATIKTPYMDGGKPAHTKNGKAMKVSLSGNWQIKAGMDYRSGTLTTLATLGTSNYDTYRIGYTNVGTHFCLQAQTTGATAAILSSFVFQYQEGSED